jgi:hypothetical protein
MPSIRVKITDSNQSEPWFASAWDDGRGPEKTVALLNRKAKVVRYIGIVKYELATEEEYQKYRAMLRAIVSKRD